MSEKPQPGTGAEVMSMQRWFRSLHFHKLSDFCSGVSAENNVVQASRQCAYGHICLDSVQGLTDYLLAYAVGDGDSVIR